MAIMAICIFAKSINAQSVPPLINYQGRLTDQTSTPLSSGSYGLQFRLWDSPTATNATDLIWGQQQNVTVQTNGVFNVIMGSPGGSSLSGPTPQVNNLAYAFNGSNCFLGVTVATSNLVSIGNPSEILPRQQLLSVPFAFTAANAANATVASSVLPGSIIPASISLGAVGLTNLAARPTGTNVPAGGVAISNSSGQSGNGSTLVVQIVTTGRPVFISLIPDGSSQPSNIGTADASTSSGANITISILRDGTIISTSRLNIIIPSAPSASYSVGVPCGAVNMMDVMAPAGSHTYTVQGTAVEGYPVQINFSRLVAIEL